MILFKKVLAAVLLVLSGVMLAGEIPSKTVEAEGFGSTVAEAEKNARENAVRQAFGEVIDSVTEIKNENLVEHTISVASGFILSYKVIGTPQRDAASQLYSVKISAVVATEKLKNHVNRLKSSSVGVNIASLMQASDDVENQEKNIYKLYDWLVQKDVNSLSVSAALKCIDSENVRLDVDVEKSSPRLEQHLRPVAEKVLLANGFVREHRDGYEGYVRLFAYHGGLAMYHPEISPEFAPRDYYYYADIITDNNERIYLGKLFSNRGFGGLSHGVFVLVDPISKSLTFKSSEVKKFKSLRIYLNYEKDYSNSGITWKEFLIKEIPIDGNALAAHQESFKKREQGVLDFLTNMYRESYKLYIPTAKPKKYKEGDPNVKIAITIDVDKRAYVKFARKMINQLTQMNLKGNGSLTIKLPSGDESKFSFPYGCGNTSLWYLNDNIIFGKKYSYVLAVKFKDKKGEVLQENYFSIPFKSVIFGCDTHYNYTFSMPGTQGFEADVTFDLPEDIPLIKNIECSFEERIQQ